MSSLSTLIYLAWSRGFRVERDIMTALDRKGQQINNREDQRRALVSWSQRRGNYIIWGHGGHLQISESQQECRTRLRVNHLRDEVKPIKQWKGRERQSSGFRVINKLPTAHKITGKKQTNTLGHLNTVFPTKWRFVFLTVYKKETQTQTRCWGWGEGQGRHSFRALPQVRPRPMRFTCVITFAVRACQWKIMKHHFVKYGAFQNGLVFFPVSSEEWNCIDCGGER